MHDASDIKNSWDNDLQSKPFVLDFNPNANLGENAVSAWQAILANLKHGYTQLADEWLDELLVCVTEKQINDALYRFVTKNVGMLHDLHLDLHDDWLRLYATVDVKGIFAQVACNFRLVDVILTADTQRLVFEQLSNTELIELHSKTWWQAPVARLGVNLYRTLTKSDPLPFLLQKIQVKNEPFAVHKGNYIYLDIHRYLAKQKAILGYLTKAQVNHGYTSVDNLLLKVQINFAELLSFGVAGEDIITEKDNPANQKMDKA